jgi:hypothetical protein
MSLKVSRSDKNLSLGKNKSFRESSKFIDTTSRDQRFDMRSLALQSTNSGIPRSTTYHAIEEIEEDDSDDDRGDQLDSKLLGFTRERANTIQQQQCKIGLCLSLIKELHPLSKVFLCQLFPILEHCKI